MTGHNQVLYLIDANVLIEANQKYYPIDRVPQYWVWLIAKGNEHQIKIPLEIWQEIADSSKGTPLRDWVNETAVKDALILKEEVDRDIFNDVINKGYASDLTEEELDQTGCDPFLIAYAMMGDDRTVVTKEVSRKTKERGNRKIPDVCSDLNLKCIDDFKLNNTLNFTIL